MQDAVASFAISVLDKLISRCLDSPLGYTFVLNGVLDRKNMKDFLQRQRLIRFEMGAIHINYAVLATFGAQDEGIVFDVYDIDDF